MIRHELLRNEGILIVEPQAPLAAADFATLVKEVDPYIEQHGQLHGLLICAASFPGWSDCAGFVSHIRFVKDHHEKIKKVAAVTDHGFLALLPRVAGHFVDADVRHFPLAEKEDALAWLGGGPA